MKNVQDKKQIFSKNLFHIQFHSDYIIFSNIRKVTSS